MTDTIKNFVIYFAIGLTIIGIITSFIDLSCLGIRMENDGYVSGLFTLSGIFLYFTALMYQIKEYRLQIIELRKSVQAQTKSSEALDEQKKILLEQNANALIFNLIDNFISYKEKNNIKKSIDNLIRVLKYQFEKAWKQELENFNGTNDLNERYANRIKQITIQSITNHEEYSVFKKYIQLTYNILHIIDRNKAIFSHDYFTPYFLSQFDSNETVILYLSNLIDQEMPIYTDLYWGYYCTKEITDLIMRDSDLDSDYTYLNISMLTDEFNKIKQH